jgi:hypothetical protein
MRSPAGRSQGITVREGRSCRLVARHSISTTVARRIPTGSSESIRSPLDRFQCPSDADAAGIATHERRPRRKETTMPATVPAIIELQTESAKEVVDITARVEALLGAGVSA